MGVVVWFTEAYNCEVLNQALLVVAPPYPCPLSAPLVSFECPFQYSTLFNAVEYRVKKNKNLKFSILKGMIVVLHSLFNTVL